LDVAGKPAQISAMRKIVNIGAGSHMQCAVNLAAALPLPTLQDKTPANLHVDSMTR
jgi:hypothetical protein